ncbi:TfoX/Sxy family protein [Devosia sp.]|uniref:TfoX/Sxy family protein n=1 Tax=Devosia sp. TaxID=1871048 RepID=UPI003A92D0BB
MPDTKTYAASLRDHLAHRPEISEKHMFGGDFFMLNGNMLCGIGKYGFMFRVGSDNEAEALRLPGAEPVAMGRKMPGFVHVEPEAALQTGLDTWLALTERYVGAMPPKDRRLGRGQQG